MSDRSSGETTSPSRWKRAFVWAERLVTAGLLVFVAVRLGPQLGALTGLAPEGPRAPSYALVTLDGDTIHSADLSGKVVVVNFWATWCIPCRLEMPSLEKLHERHHGEDLVVLGFDTDVGNESGVRRFLAERGVTYPVGRATARQRAAFGGIPGIPTTFIVDRSGVIRHKVVGYFAPPALEAAVSRLLDDPAAGVP
ncbi:MAG: TlpA family protein disulfide reductase [Gemmatimonadetes bacterium]|nr:TlpA family protein disulfide reductase [Gemmatimonadota bacterium]